MELIIDKRCPTYNHLYWHRGNMKIMKSDAKELRRYIIKCVDEQIEPETILGLIDKKLSITMEIHENWFTKKDLVKKLDLDNRCKFLIDSVCIGLRIDDKFVFGLKMKKVQSKEEKARVIIEVLNENKN
tara:strand:+ start:181 stop:567 length:387 start_codon:yes stop_codon:yes gene_type:complete